MGSLITTPTKSDNVLFVGFGGGFDILLGNQFAWRTQSDLVYDHLFTDLDIPVEIDGVRFAPGDLVVADVDGVVVVPRAIEAAVVRRAWDKVHAENQVRDAIRGGMKATDAFSRFGIL